MVLGDKDLLYRAFYNILTNGQQAMEGPGIMYVTARREEDRIILLFRDSGPGIDEDLLPNLLEPFFTTKDGGTGLGLPIVQSIIVSHGGQLSLRNAEEGGAEVRVELPAAPLPEQKDETPAAAHEAPDQAGSTHE